MVNSKREQGSLVKKIGFHTKNAFIFLMLYLMSQLATSTTTLPFFIGGKLAWPRPLSGVISILMLLIFVGGSYAIAKRIKVVNLKKIVSKKNIVLTITGVILLQAVGYLSIFFQGGQTNRAGIYDTVTQGSSAMTLFVFFTMAAPIIEEVIFRGFIQGYWFKDSPKMGFVISVVLFTLVHVPNNSIVFIQYFVTSLIYAAVYQKTKRLEITTGMHILNNMPAGVEIILNLF